MIISSINARALEIPFRFAFAHASAVRAKSQSIWVEVETSDGIVGYGEGCPREYVTGESIASTRQFVDRHRDEIAAFIHDLTALRTWRRRHADRIDAAPAAWTAIEIALLDALGKSAGLTVERLLGKRDLRAPLRYTAVLGDAEPRAFALQLGKYLDVGFGVFKVKLSGVLERDRAKRDALVAAGVRAHAVRADANNLWGDAEDAIRYLAALRYDFWALEEPLRAGDIAGMARIAEALGVRIVLDESLARAAQIDVIPHPRDRWIANVRVSKMGGVLRSLALVDELQASGIDIIVGAHVGETSALARAALTVAASAGERLIAMEGAAGTHLLSADVARVPVMFQAGGLLDPSTQPSLRGPGWGLEIALPLV